MHGPPPTPTTPGFPATDESVQRSAPPQIPDYELLRRIGSGSYGDVWVARNVLGQFRAVKIIYRGRFADPRPFEREFEGIQRFEPISRSHPSQLHILHVGKNDAAGCFYYVMELADAVEPRGGSKPVNSNQCSVNSAPEVPGPRVATGHPASGADSLNTDLLITDYSPRTLRSLLSPAHFPTGSPAPAGRLPIPDCVQIGLSLATALAHLHEQGLVHRDIKPSNIIFVNGAAKLGDIGLVTEAGDTQSIVGTEGYLPPEGPGTPQADLYSLGKVLYEVSTGIDRRRFPALPEESWTWPDRDQLMEFNEIVLRACAKAPAQRYQTAEELRADLALLHEGKSVRQKRAWEQHFTLVKRISLAAALLALLAVSGRGFWKSFAGPRQTTGNEMRGTTNREAWNHYRQGHFFADKPTRIDNSNAIAHFTKAIELDPRFARAHAELAMEVIDLAFNGGVPAHECFPKAEVSARRALELDPTLAEAWAVLGKTKASYGWDLREGERLLRQALIVEPDNVSALISLSICLNALGRTNEAITAAKRAVELEPTSRSSNRNLGNRLLDARRFEEAVQQFRKLIELDPSNEDAWWYLADACDQLGLREEAMEARLKKRRRAGASDRDIEILREQYLKIGSRAYWNADLEEVRNIGTNHISRTWAAMVCCHAGEYEEAIAWLQSAYDDPYEFARIRVYPGYDPLRTDPRFQELLLKTGLDR